LFFDESGDFGPYRPHSPYYVLAMVMHDQRRDITGQLDRIHDALVERGLPADHPIHTGPLIRREHDYAWMTISERRSIFRTLSKFVRESGAQIKTWTFDKRKIGAGEDLENEMAKSLGAFILGDLEFFRSQDRIVVYYDNGQKEITRLLTLLLSAMLSNVEFRKVAPSQYSLFQAADWCCTLELLKSKLDTGALTASERDFFSTPRASAERALRKVHLPAFERMQFH